MIRYKSWAIPEGNVVKVTDESGVVIWAVAADDFDGTFKVKKITATTYAGETSYSSEKFILLNIYPKTNGTVSVTYGGLTKTITDTSGAAEPNAQKVFFGTFNGVSDSVETPDSGVLTIGGACRGVGVGTYAASSKSSTNYCACITAVGDISGFETIPNNAFYNCTSIKSVAVPTSVTTIGNYAFYQCSGLTNIDMPSSVKSIGTYAFYKCTALTGITIPNNVTKIESDTFTSCTSLTSVTIPANVTEIGNSAFYNCNGITNLTIPQGVSKINDYAFAYCKSLTTVTIPTGVTDINQSVFSNCTGLRSVTLHNNVRTISKWAFEDCTSLSNMVIPASVTTVGENPWVGCNTTLTLASGNANYRMDGNCLIRIVANQVVVGFANSVIPSYVTDIRSYAFASCANLTAITIPASVTNIENYVFSDSRNLAYVTFLGTTPPTLGDGMKLYSETVDDTTTTYYPMVIVPKGYLATYRAAETWSSIPENNFVEAS